jgi:molybdenum cofactor biosynthesis protein B
MGEPEKSVVRVMVGAITLVKSKTLEEIAKAVCEEVTGAGYTLIRSVTVHGEVPVIQQLISNVSNDNEADVIILVGGTGFGPRDHACEAIDAYVERRIEGFAEAYRHLLRGPTPPAEAYRGDAGPSVELGAHTWLVRATAGVYNQCLVFALTGRLQDVRSAVRTLICPTLGEAVQIATGKLRPVHLRA